MSERSRLISKLLTDRKARFAYIKAKLGVLVPSQIRALRLKSGMPRQADLAKSASMQQSRISMLETPGASNLTLEKLASLAAVFQVGLIVKFVPFSEMLRWENSFSQDSFNVLRLKHDTDFLPPKMQPSITGLSLLGNLVLPSAGIASLPSGQHQPTEQQQEPRAQNYAAPKEQRPAQPAHEIGMMS